mgnify:FL=1
MTDSSGAVVGSTNGEFITDELGRIVLEGLEPGTTVTAKEIKTVEGFVLGTTPKSINGHMFMGLAGKDMAVQVVGDAPSIQVVL